MDADRFDRLSRALSPDQTRRRFLTRLGGGLVLLAPLTTADDTLGKKKKKGKRKKKQPCSPVCTGARTCQGGACVCPAGTEECGGECRNACGANRERNPFTCDCCTVHAGNCFSQGACCSGVCIVGGAGFCAGRAAGDACSFGGQCASGSCNGYCGT